MEALFGTVDHYVALLVPWVTKLKRMYPHTDLALLFESIPLRSIVIAPMVLCDATATDLGVSAPDDVLRGVGLLSFHIGTHDDLVDERPQERAAIGALLYAGNIAALEGVHLLAGAVPRTVLKTALERIAGNHRAQQECVTRLWDRKPVNFADYKRGIEHVALFASIGVLTALALSEAPKERKRLLSFCDGYGTALQLLDDIAETGEDAVLGYHSFPLLDGRPYRESFRKVYAHLTTAERALAPSWQRLRALVTYAHAFANDLERTEKTQ